MIDARRIYDWLSGSPWSVVVAVAVLVALYESVRRGIRRWLVARRMRLQMRRALAAETRAARLLARAGYAVVGSQVKGSYDLWFDGEPVTIELRADYVVERRRRRFVAEVKSGEFAPSIATPATRRQLLEYRVAFAVDGVLLVDGEAGSIHEVVFPAAASDQPTRSRQATLAPF